MICVVCGLFICSLLTRVQVICDIIFSDFLICLNLYVMLMWTRDISMTENVWLYLSNGASADKVLIDDDFVVLCSVWISE